MKITYPTTATVEASAIRCIVPVDEQDREQMPEPFPGLVGDTLTMTLDLDTRKVRGWPEGRTAKLCLKPVDEGRYELLDGSGNILASKEDYVPPCVPGEFGDYFEPTIETDGTVKGWKPKAADVVASFWKVRD